MNVFTKKKKKMSVNCMMKLKPLALNEKYESGPGPLQGPGAPGICRKQSDSGVGEETRVRPEEEMGPQPVCPSEG